ncbi:MAG: MarR family transcriptional regulator, partial [Pseudarthrobacter sp.]|nr:MarR family transcriptional regulator [Pseudarthrobacter sp.]
MAGNKTPAVPGSPQGRPAPGGPPQGPPQRGGPHPLIRLLQEFTLEANRYVDAAGGRKDMHRTDLNALAVIMRHTANG